MDCVRKSFLVLALGSGVLLSGCSEDLYGLLPTVSIDHQDSAEIARVRSSDRTDGPPSGATSDAQASIRDEISVASWNIQVFGKSKMRNRAAMRVIVDMVRRFDLTAIQELRSKDQSVIDRFLAMVNRGGYAYDVVVGPRLGRTSSKEQYLYLYDTSRIQLIDGSVFTLNDPRDLLHREPLVASFRVIGAHSANPWTFTLVNIHTDPDEVRQEVNALDDVIRVVRRMDSEDDVILLGDLNANERQLGELSDLPNIMWTVRGQPTNTRGTKSYDNILFSGTTTSEFTGHAGVVDLVSEYALTARQALAVSDHLPVWATFAPVERSKTLAVDGRFVR